ncbi:hypothetical protein HHK36_001715 [Tetracentron sinense]|uniref:RING-CH-type domain-containing protein n=1 Tax=Tetracentron sinense TaxID=13715 RepID=A0A835A472_TETSI|nr:hypothetical protein HHK36_001715 [Tetracentron sinense]
MDHEINDQQKTGENSSNPVDPVQKGTSESSANSVDRVELETIIVIGSVETEIGSGENGDPKAKANELETSKVSVERRKVIVSEPEKHTCVIDIKPSGGALSSENLDGEKVCRICHLSSDRPSETSNLIQLGCGCKDELGIAHRHCAEAWFRLKGNRLCEICGETAKNITGIEDNRFMEEWNERRMAVNYTHSAERGGGCWRGQPFCNFLMGCLVIAFVLPWFFRVNMF